MWVDFRGSEDGEGPGDVGCEDLHEQRTGPWFRGGLGEILRARGAGVEDFGELDSGEEGQTFSFWPIFSRFGFSLSSRFFSIRSETPTPRAFAIPERVSPDLTTYDV